MVVGSVDLTSQIEPFIWDAANGLRTVRSVLEDAGLGAVLVEWDLGHAYAVSDDGTTITGWGQYSPRGGRRVSQSWIAVLTDTSLAGDYNASGQVEQGDLDLVLQNWGRDITNTVPAGWTNDLPVGVIDQAELDGVLQNWGSAASPDLRGINVPEPGFLAVGVLGMGLAGRCRRTDGFRTSSR